MRRIKIELDKCVFTVVLCGCLVMFWFKLDGRGYQPKLVSSEKTSGFGADDREASRQATTELASSVRDPGIELGPDGSNRSEVTYFNISAAPSTYTLTPGGVTCSQRQTYLIYIMTAPDHFTQRSFIRDTWANVSLLSNRTRHGFHIERMFVVGGLRFMDGGVSRRIVVESNREKDILTVDALYDSYNNLTKKTLYAMYWIKSHCNLTNVDYLLKADDDIVFDIEYILRKVWGAMIAGNPMDILCYHMKNKSVIRTGKYRELESVYPGDIYPNYCSGPAYTLNSRIFLLLFQGIPQTPIMQSEDVMLTGVCLHKLASEDKLNIHALPMRSYLSEISAVKRHFKKHMRNMKSYCSSHRVHLIHELPFEHWIEAYRYITARSRDP